MEYPGDNFYIEKILSGDTSAFAHLVNRHKDMAFTIAVRILKNREDAEEIAQDAFLKAYNSLNKFKQKSKFSTWLYSIVYNAAISRIRKKQLEMLPVDDHIIENYTFDDITTGINEIDEEEQKKFINNAIAELPETESVLITLYYKEENSIDQISAIVGLSSSNVKVKLHRIRKKLLTEFNGYIKKKEEVKSIT
ncbi:MAG: sigma-70 family RNA polymerase sigma factor [Bacteroidales bacterium]|nr:sigma-70 family RNA polymerase sigma factor [Bacteroidales bacterium]